jgi:hypothetical protein
MESMSKPVSLYRYCSAVSLAVEFHIRVWVSDFRIRDSDLGYRIEFYDRSWVLGLGSWAKGLGPRI